MSNISVVKHLAGIVLFMLATTALAQSNAELAKKYNLRGIAAIEIARSESDLNAAATEFRKAVEADPKMATAWNNLGMLEAKLKHYENAISAFQEYLKLEPKGKQASTARDQITKLEYYLERSQAQMKLEATWASNDGNYRLTLNGGEFRLQSSGLVDVNGNTVTPYFKDMFGMYSSRRTEGKTTITYLGRIEGDQVRGERIRAAFTEGVSGCVVPETKVPFQGRLLNDGKNMQIRFDDAHYRANWTGVFWGLTSCTEIFTDGNQPHEVGFTRQ